MDTVLVPTAYLPNIEYVALLQHYGSAAVEVCETYPKQTCRNRTTILTANGLLRLSVPVIKTNGNHTLTSDIHVAYAEHWQLQHVRAIESAYGTAPYFMYYWDEIREIIMSRHKYLTDLNEEITKTILKLMKIDCDCSRSADYLFQADNDFRNIFNHNSAVNFPKYYQVWSDRHPFSPNLCILDLLFNVGHVEAQEYLRNISNQLVSTIK